MTDRKKPGVAFWATVVVVVVLAYPLSFGPVLWIDSQGDDSIIPDWAVAALDTLYYPITAAMDNGPPIICAPLRWYLGLWVDDLSEYSPTP
jgi:hypothetical protein